MRTLGEVIMIAAALALVAVAFAAGYQRFDRPWRELRRTGEWPVLRPRIGSRFFAEHSAWTVFLALFLLAGIG